METKDPFYDRDYNLCIVCARCTRACDELRGDVAIGMTERAGQVLVGTVMGDSLLESGLRVLWSVYRCLPGWRANRNREQVGTRGPHGAVGVRRVPRGLHDDL